MPLNTMQGTHWCKVVCFQIRRQLLSTSALQYRPMQAYKLQKASLLPPIHVCHGHVIRTHHYWLVLYTFLVFAHFDKVRESNYHSNVSRFIDLSRDFPLLQQYYNYLLFSAAVGFIHGARVQIICAFLLPCVRLRIAQNKFIGHRFTTPMNSKCPIRW